jgi:hypothetical protein
MRSDLAYGWFPAIFLIFVSVLASCTTAQVAQVASYQAAVQNACAIAEGEASGSVAMAIPDVARAVMLAHSACDREEAIASLILSPTSVAWLNTLITTIKSGGKVVPPAPVENP